MVASLKRDIVRHIVAILSLCFAFCLCGLFLTDFIFFSDRSCIAYLLLFGVSIFLTYMYHPDLNMVTTRLRMKSSRTEYHNMVSDSIQCFNAMIKINKALWCSYPLIHRAMDSSYRNLKLMESSGNYEKYWKCNERIFLISRGILESIEEASIPDKQLVKKLEKLVY